MTDAQVMELGADGAFDVSADVHEAPERAEELRQQGNAAFQRRAFSEAHDLYTQGIALQRDNHLLYGNRSAASYQLRDYEAARVDADKAIALAPSWSKAYLRRALACEALREWEPAIASYKQITRLDPTGTSPEARKALTKLTTLEHKARAKPTVKRGFLASRSKKPQKDIYPDKASTSDDPPEPEQRTWSRMLRRLLDGCNKRGVNGQGERVVLDDGVFAKLLDEREFQRLVYPGIPPEQLIHAPKNLQRLLEDPWYEQELLALMPKVQAKATSVLANVKKRSAALGDVMDEATERMLLPQVLQEAFGREVLAMVHRVNFQKHVSLANDARTLADPESDLATWDQLDDVFLDTLLTRDASVLDDFMGDDWAVLLLNDVHRMNQNGLLLDAAGNVDAKHMTNQPEAANVGAKLRFVEHAECEREYPALAELVEKLHALPYEMNRKRPSQSKLCAQFAHCTALHHLPLGHRQPLRLDCGSGDKDNGFKLTCVYFFHEVSPSADPNGGELDTTSVRLRRSLEEDASVTEIAPQSDRLLVFKSQAVYNEITRVADPGGLFYLTFWIHGQELL